MSASEQLRNLHAYVAGVTTANGIGDIFKADALMGELFDALPLIADAIAAAERVNAVLEDFSEGRMDAYVALGTIGVKTGITSALAVLDDALKGTRE